MPVVESPQGACLFGIARCNITPPIGIYHRMWGASKHDRSTGVHRPLSATATVFGDLSAKSRAESTNRVILVAIDHCLLWQKEMDDLLAGVTRSAKLPSPQLYITFSHTHAAGLMGRERASLPGGELVGPYLDELAIRIAGAVRQAIKDAEPAWIVFGQGRCDLATHRDFWDEATQQIVCGFNPGGPADDLVLVARVSSESTGRTKAVLVNYACHPTSLGWQNTLISPDYPGAMREVVEQVVQAPCVFLQGASGDLGPREAYSDDPEVADRNGRHLGYAAISATEALPPAKTSFAYSGAVVSGATLGTWRHVPMEHQREQACRRWRMRNWNIRLPLRKDLPSAEETRSELEEWRSREESAHARGDLAAASDCRAQVERMTRRLVKLAELPADGQFDLPLTLWQTGDAFWLSLEAEYYHWFQRELRDRHADTPIMIATLTNGWRPSYLPPADVYGRDIYQEQVSLLAPGALERVLEEVDAAISTWCDH
ncbi:MAG: neutral/alkaline non-lysosomal ceramidase N-terminal domain-containing protein [Pirellulales bacterium]|nr:neutral/alkaline non-lysosomal ceramidase N-terminal domain-containing protein [Pirellulales bacterium]